jgi:hypothetical protein
MTYWWASQNRNYRTVIPLGTLWSRPTVTGAMRKDRTALKSMEPDDVVFHYGGACLRAVSRVVSTWIPSDRPPGYPIGQPTDGVAEDGWLVRVEPFAVGLELHRDDVCGIVGWGSPGPLTRSGKPQEKYVSELRDADAVALLRRLDLREPSRSVPGRPHEDWRAWSGATDAEAMTTIRREQRALRAHLLDGRDEAPCGICSRELPSDLLVAGHILPRSMLDEEQRADFQGHAMLVCLLGCDALFERGYIVVTPDGRLARGVTRPQFTFGATWSGPIGQKVNAWSPGRADAFERHRLLHE